MLSNKKKKLAAGLHQQITIMNNNAILMREIYEQAPNAVELEGAARITLGWFNTVLAEIEVEDNAREAAKIINNMGKEKAVEVGESKSTDLLCCPFCEGESAWCDTYGSTHDTDNECALIICTECKCEFDLSAGGEELETLIDLKNYCSVKFNTRRIK